MPNWVTTNIYAPSHVIRSLVTESGEITFETIMPKPDGFRGLQRGGYSFSAGEIAQNIFDALKQDRILGRPEDRTLAQLVMQAVVAEATTRELKWNRVTSDDEIGNNCAEVLEYVQNLLDFGVANSLDWNRSNWGTKWDACEASITSDGTCMSFETAWCCPAPVIAKLSLMFPDVEILVEYADEDIGYNCGRYVLLNGEDITEQKIKDGVEGPWSGDPNIESWTEWACDIKGWNSTEYLE